MSAQTSTSKRRKTRVAHLVVEGSFLTSTAREMLLSERPAAAWRLLTQGLVGDGAEKAAIAILEGRSRLAGDSDEGVTLEDEDPAVCLDFAAQVRQVYVGRVRIGSTWYAPRAEVVDFGPGDVPEVRGDGVVEQVESMGEALSIIRGFVQSRVAFYARQGERLVEITRTEAMPLRTARVGARVFLIFRPVNEPPFWWDEEHRPEAALEQFFAAGRVLEEESWQARFGGGVIEGEAPIEGEPPMYGRNAVSERGREARREREEVQEALSLVAWSRELASLRERILAQAGDDLMEMVVEGVTRKVPRAPFERWALDRTSLSQLAPAWEPVSPSGVKLPMDDRCHTDWLIGAGFDPSDGCAYKGALNEVSSEAREAVQENYGSFECGVLVDGPRVVGVVGKEIAVLRDLHPDNIDVVLRSRAVITQTGGQLAHLSMVAAERSIPMLRVSDALLRFPPGTELAVDASKGAITVLREPGVARRAVELEDEDAS